MGGDCDEALRGGARGHCEEAARGGCQHTPEVLEKCRQIGKECGVQGAAWGKFGGRKPSDESVGSAPQMAK